MFKIPVFSTVCVENKVIIFQNFFRVFKNNVEVNDVSDVLQDKEYYIALFTKNTIDKQHIYNLTKRINDCLHTEFGIKNLYHRMIFTACALVAKRYEAILVKGMSVSLMKTSILLLISSLVMML